MDILSKLAFGVGMISILYYGVVIYYAGIRASFSWIWLLLGTGCFLASLILRYLYLHDIVLSKVLVFAGVIPAAAVVAGLALIEGIIIYHSREKADPGMDFIIVLGAQVKGRKITKSLGKRLEAAAAYLEENPTTKTIVSGGRGPGEEITEAEAMAAYLSARGISSEKILKEDKSTNTEENIRFSKQYIRNDKARVAVVTNGFHIFRALRLARKQGFTGIQGIAAPSDPLLSVNYYVREVFGVIKDLVRGNLA